MFPFHPCRQILAQQFCVFGRSNCGWTLRAETNNQGNLGRSMQISWQLPICICSGSFQKIPWKSKTHCRGRENERYRTSWHFGLLQQFDSEDFAFHKVIYESWFMIDICVSTWISNLYMVLSRTMFIYSFFPACNVWPHIYNRHK